MSTEFLRCGVTTNVNITDDTGAVLLDKSNSIHPQNMSRIIARALSSEPNSSFYKLALGRGGTFVDATGDVSYRRPNDGISPDTAGWQSRLYDETYSELVNSPTNTQNSVASHVLPTGESQIIVTCVLASNEPASQLANSLYAGSINGTFVFDELGLFTSGMPQTATQGYHDALLGTVGKISTDITYLNPVTTYNFTLIVDGVPKSIVFTTPLVGTGLAGAFTYSDLIGMLNAEFARVDAGTGKTATGAVAQVTQPGVNTFGALRFVSLTTGSASSVAVVSPSTGYPTNWLFTSLLQSLGGPSVWTGFGTPYMGHIQGEEDNNASPDRERERLLTHLIFSPLQKDASRSWKITYKLTVVVSPTTYP